MTRTHLGLLALLAVGACDASEKPAPLVMFLIDSSGSMERVPECACETPSCDECLPDCDAGERNRWATLLEVMTGSYEDFRCTRTSRNGLGYDTGYYLPFHEPTDGAQMDDGMLDLYASALRFGFASFDGWDTMVGAPPLVSVSDFDLEKSADEDGLWSYGAMLPDGSLRVREDGRPAGAFHYPNCPTDYMMDTGVRGPQAAEGALRLAYSNDDASTVRTAIEHELRAMRTYGGTPIAAALDDLRYLFAEDPEVVDRLEGDARERHVILITDGYPDDDYRSFGCNCANEQDGDCGDSEINDPADMFCPYPKAEDAAHALVDDAVGQLHVVGFAVDDSEVRERLDAIAASGGTTRARHASSRSALRVQLRAILDAALER